MDKTTAERQRRYREKKKEKIAAGLYTPVTGTESPAAIRQRKYRAKKKQELELLKKELTRYKNKADNNKKYSNTRRGRVLESWMVNTVAEPPVEYGAVLDPSIWHGTTDEMDTARQEVLENLRLSTATALRTQLGGA